MSEIDSILLAAGWFDRRNVLTGFSVPGEFALFPPAAVVLSEFAGLHFGKCGPGIDKATSDVEIDPNLATHVAPELKMFERSFNTRLYPLGEVHRGHGYLIIDELGRVYLLTDDLVPFASTFRRSLEQLLLGIKPDPLEIAKAWPVSQQSK